MSGAKVRVVLHGPLRDAAGRDRLELAVPPSARVRDLRAALAAALPSQAGLIRLCAFADRARLLRDDAPLRGRRFDALPPVAGG